MLDRAQWVSPDEQYRIHPFWFWNGEMTEEQIEHQINEMADKGVGGFFICPRQGLQIPYLSHAWFEKVRFAIDAAGRRNMQVWLYDEYPYPSGIAGGEVTLAHPEAKHYSLVHRAERVSGGDTLTLELPWARILYAKAVPLDASGVRQWEQAVDIRAYIGNYQADPIFQKAGLTAYNQKRFFTYRTVYKLIWAAPPGGDWEAVFFFEEEIDDFKYYGTFVDPCNREAMEAFIRMTHDRYAEYVGDTFGNTVKGMFTDEIGLLGSIPWSPQLPAYFKERSGYELKDRLPALVFGDAEDTARVRYDYYQAVHLLLRESYHKQVHDWCERHGLQYVAEVPSVRMTTQLFSHVPGGDSAHEKLGRSLDWILNRYADNMRANPKMVSSLARQLGRDRNLIECFHSVGWSMTLQDAKWMIDRMAAMGTNFYNFHAFFYTLDGLTKHDAPPSQFLQNPYWAHFRKLGDYTGRISYLMSEGKADIRIAVLDPVTTLWTHMGNPFHSFHHGGEEPAEKERLDRLKKDWAAIGIHLLKDRRDYDHLDPELLSEADVKDGTVKLGYAEYDVLILPPMTNLEAAAWKAVIAFHQAGGTVIALGLLPYESIEPGSPGSDQSARLFGADAQTILKQYWGAAGGSREIGSPWLQGEGSAYFVPQQGEAASQQSLERLSALLDSVLPRTVTLETERDSDVFLMQTRRLADGSTVVFITNQEGKEQETGLMFHGLRETATFRELELETGNSKPIFADAAEQGRRLPLHFAPYQSRVIQCAPDTGKTDNGVLSTANDSPWHWDVRPDGPWELSALHPNALRLDTFQLRFGSNPDEVTVKAKTFIDQCSDLTEDQRYPLSFGQVFGTPMKLSMSYPLPCVYRTEFIANGITGVCRLFMDASAISGEWVLRINGHALTKHDFVQEHIYDHSNVVCRMDGLLRNGLNELEVEVSIGHDWDGVVDALYLEGSFGVVFDDSRRPVLTAPPVRAAALAGAGAPQQGYPYYAGTLAFKKSVLLDTVPGTETFELQFPGWEIYDCVEVHVNGQPLGVRPWTPYRWSGSTGLLRPGDNEVQVRVTGSLIGLLEGKYFDYAGHRLIQVEEQ